MCSPSRSREGNPLVCELLAERRGRGCKFRDRRAIRYKALVGESLESPEYNASQHKSAGGCVTNGCYKNATTANTNNSLPSPSGSGCTRHPTSRRTLISVRHGLFLTLYVTPLSRGFDHGGQNPRTDRAGRYSLLTERSHWCLEPREGGDELESG